MASKVMVKIPVQPFAQVSKSKTNGVSNEVMTIGRTTEIGRVDSTSKSPDGGRVAQLEQNIRYLQEQHQLMLSGLHHEIDNLRHRNRELQFQLVFAKGTNVSTPSSPEDEMKHKLYNSPKQINITPLQVEILEKELGELKIQLQESESRNVYLSAIVDEQKKKLERYERDRERERERGIQPDPELLRKLDDAESLIRRLRRENSDLRRESANNQLANNASNFPQREYNNGHRDGGSSSGGGGGGGGNSYHHQQQHHQGRGGVMNHHHHQGRGGGGGGGGNSGGRNRGNSGNGSNQYNRGNWFPPLHSQSYWQNGRGQERSNNGAGTVDGTSLPSLQPNNGGDGNSSQYQARRSGNNNQYGGGGGGGTKYRGNQNRGQKHS